MQLLKADTLTKVLIGPAVAVGDGFTPVTTLALTTADEAEILKHDAAAVTSISANTFAAIAGADGYYNLAITAAQLDTEGRLTVIINDDSLILPIRCDFMVVNANVFDSLYAASGTDVLDTNVAQWLGTAVATPTTAGVPEVDTTHVSGTAQTANDNGADINTLLTRIVGTLAAGTHNPASAAQIAVLSDLIDGGRLDLLIDAIKVVTDAQAATGTGLTAIPWNAAWDAEVQSEVNDGLVAFFTSAAQLVDDIYDEATSGHNVGGSFGKAIRQIKEGTVSVESAVNDVSATTTSFVTDLTEATDNHYTDASLVFISGALTGQSRSIFSYNGTTKTIVLDEALTEAPADGDGFIVKTDHIHTVAQIQSGLATTAELDKVPKSDGAVAHNATALAAITADVVGDAVIAELTTQGDTNETKLDTLTTNVATVDTVVDNLNLGIIYGAAATGTLSTTQATSDLTGYANDQLIGRVIIWTSGACEGEGADITDYASASGLLTFTALTTAPANADTFKIV